VGGALPAGGAPSGGASGSSGGSSGRGSSFRNSRVALCSQVYGRPGQHSIWSDGKSVYFVGSNVSSTGFVYSNNGTGWGEQAFPARDFRGVAGPAGYLQLFLQQNSTGCGVALLSQGAIICSAPTRVDQIAVVSQALSFALAEGGQVIRFSDNYWMRVGARLDTGAMPQVPHGSIWGTQKRLFVTTVSGSLYRFESPAGANPVGQPENAPVMTYSALFGFSENDVWAGTTDGALVHFDGNRWDPTTIVPNCGGGVQALWGSNGILYAISDNVLVRVIQRKAEVLSREECDGPKWVSLWGDSPQEVYLVQNDTSLENGACGSTRLFWFNGTRIGPL